MTCDKNILLEDFLLKFVYKFTDKFDNELYVFKVSHDAELCKIKKEIKKMKKDDLTMGWTYEKDGDLYIKVKKKNLKKSNKFNFEKDDVYKTHLNLVYYDYMDKKGYFCTMHETEYQKDVFDSD